MKYNRVNVQSIVSARTRGRIGREAGKLSGKTLFSVKRHEMSKREEALNEEKPRKRKLPEPNPKLSKNKAGYTAIQSRTVGREQ